MHAAHGFIVRRDILFRRRSIYILT